ncbi:hypothetical protein CAY60_010510 [Shouchella clausii]|nr:MULTISPECIES: hypothetical protein [Shouchella]MCM3313293.1 hypothetical protein [Psychrobacillus sp. MER TA 17]MBU3232373.1 hypothetical protein [Shouchella clausii]MBU3263408.1 hypothetical protein [Shouchella clausii]MBU3505873.1 hypothetical protein [Shouchella clausii]MBU3533823.1 hypothetical protein [Shouchella clausii]
MNQHLRDSLAMQLGPTLSATYRKLVSSRYFSPAHLEVLALEAKRSVEATVEPHWRGYMLFIKTIYAEAQTEGRWEACERRLEHFFESIHSYLLTYLKQLSATKEERLYGKEIVKQLKASLKDDQSPWPKLLQASLPVFSAASLEAIEQSFAKASFDGAAKQVRLAASYFYLFIGKELQALQFLVATNNLATYDVEDHFMLLAKRGRHRQIQHWLSQLFPDQKSHLGSLQRYADESETALQPATSVHYGTWDRWLQAPMFTRFEQLVAAMGQEQVSSVLAYLLPKLEERLYNEATRIVYVQLLNRYRYFDQARDYFLLYEKNPLSLQPPKIELLEALATNRPELALPVYHQFVVRLVEKRSRKHYVAAAEYVIGLKELYRVLGQHVRYREYIGKLKKVYKTYRAFIEELNHLEKQ